MVDEALLDGWRGEVPDFEIYPEELEDDIDVTSDEADGEL